MVKRFTDQQGNTTTNANANANANANSDLAVDAMLQAENLDEILSFVKYVGGKLWIIDDREPDSRWDSAFCRINELADGLRHEDLLNRDTVLDFYLTENDQKDGGLVARNVHRVRLKDH